MIVDSLGRILIDPLVLHRVSGNVHHHTTDLDFRTPFDRCQFTTVAMICWSAVCDGMLKPAAPVGVPIVSVVSPFPVGFGVKVASSDAAAPVKMTEELIDPIAALVLVKGTVTLKPGLSCALPT